MVKEEDYGDFFVFTFPPEALEIVLRINSCDGLSGLFGTVCEKLPLGARIVANQVWGLENVRTLLESCKLSYNAHLVRFDEGTYEHSAEPVDIPVGRDPELVYRPPVAGEEFIIDMRSGKR